MKSLILTLATTGKNVLLDCDNVAMAAELEDESVCTRVFLKEPIDDDTKWVDVQESAIKIAKMLR